jgi:carboxypeptidase C (cathepsin A)
MTSLSLFIGQTGRNQYDISSFSADPGEFAQPTLLTRYLNLPAVQVALGIIAADDPPMEWVWHSPKVSMLHILAGDIARSTDVLLPELIDHGINILLYEGTLDIICGYHGARAVVESLGLVNGKLNEDSRVWNHGRGRYLCSSKSRKEGVGQFCYLEIDGVGHSVASEYDGWAVVFDQWIAQGSV